MSEIENEDTGVSKVPPEEQALLDKNKELIASLRDKYDEVAVWAAPPRFGGVIVAAVPLNPKIVQAFINAVNDPKVDKAVAQENYAMQCVVHPDKETTKQIFSRKPFLSAKIAGRVSEMAGADAKELGKG